MHGASRPTVDLLRLAVTSNLRKAHVTLDSIGPAPWAISVQRAIK